MCTTFNQAVQVNRQDFFFNHNRHNEININNALVYLSATHEKYRMNVGLHAGTYAQDNYAHEQVMLRNIYEANVGVSLNKKNKLWLDAGIFGSHMGFESALSMDNPTLTRSFVAENSPYYLSGAKLTYELGDTWEFAGIVSNGWQRIQRVSGNSMLSGGTQVVYSPSENFLLNWSTFLSTEDPDSTRRMRYFSNLYSSFKIGEKLSMIAGFDAGFQQVAIHSANYHKWLAPVLIAKYEFTNQWGMAFRSEYFHDQNGVIIAIHPTINEFKTLAFSTNIDYHPEPNIAIRLEARYLKATKDVFQSSSGYSNDNFFITLSIATKLQKKP
jgi:hypothetical protein